MQGQDDERNRPGAGTKRSIDDGVLGGQPTLSMDVPLWLYRVDQRILKPFHQVDLETTHF